MTTIHMIGKPFYIFTLTGVINDKIRIFFVLKIYSKHPPRFAYRTGVDLDKVGRKLAQAHKSPYLHSLSAKDHSSFVQYSRISKDLNKRTAIAIAIFTMKLSTKVVTKWRWTNYRSNYLKGHIACKLQLHIDPTSA